MILHEKMCSLQNLIELHSFSIPGYQSLVLKVGENTESVTLSDPSEDDRLEFSITPDAYARLESKTSTVADEFHAGNIECSATDIESIVRASLLVRWLFYPPVH